MTPISIIIVIIMLIHVFFLKAMIEHPMHDYYVYANTSVHIFHRSHTSPLRSVLGKFSWCVLAGLVVLGTVKGKRNDLFGPSSVVV